MVCIDAGISGSFDGLNVTVAVSADIFLDKLNTLMLGLSQDTLNIDSQLYTEFLTYYIEGETSLYIIQSLTSIKATVFSYCSMMAAEITQQEGDVANNAGVQISNENIEEKITFYATERQKLESLLQSIEYLLSTCGSQTS